MTAAETARHLLSDWKKDRYIFGLHTLPQLGLHARTYGAKAAVIANERHLKPFVESALASLAAAGIRLAGGRIIRGAKPNAPLEDLYRITAALLQYQPDMIIAIGGGSTLDVAKAANVLYTLGGVCEPEIDAYFGTGVVSACLQSSGRKLLPMLAIPTSASSGAHLTKYANITDMSAGQKKLVVDPAIVPDFALFDYTVTTSMPRSVTVDGILDAFSHTFEVFCGAKGDAYARAEDITATTLRLLLENSEPLLHNLSDMQAREAIGLATDLGGMAIMVGGTSGAHLTSFSLVDILPHGTACGLMNPYYAIFYSPAIQPQLHMLGRLYHQHGFLSADPDALSGRSLATAVAQGMMAFNRSIGAPATLQEVEGFTEGHITRALAAAKDPQLAMKLQNMPVPLSTQDVDTYMASILRAAVSGDVRLVLSKEG